jgi:hypothetical protein
MRMGASFRMAPGVYVHSSGGGAVMWAFFLAAMWFTLWFYTMVAAGIIAAAYLLIVAVRRGLTQSKLKVMEANALSPVKVRVVGNYTDPKTWGVYRTTSPSKSNGATFHQGNHPIRQIELVREGRDVELVVLFTNREDAVRLKQLLSNGSAVVSHDA